MIRINTQGNVDTWTRRPEAGWARPEVRPQDIFVLNTRFTGQRPVPGDDLRGRRRSSRPSLRATFPCNRIIALNGMSLDPTQAGLRVHRDRRPERLRPAHRLRAGRLERGRATDPARPPWTDKFPTAFPRIKGWNFGLASTAAANPVGAGQAHRARSTGHRQTGTTARSPRTSTSRTLALGARKLGPQSVQTQDACADGGAGRLRRAGQAAAPPIHVQVHHQEDQGQGQEEEGEEDHPAAAEEEGRSRC